MSGLYEGRLHLHYAVQPIANCGEKYALPKDDFSHTSLSYNPDTGSFQGAYLGESKKYVGLDIGSFSLFIAGQGGGRISEKSLFGLTLQEGFNWLSGELQKSGFPDAEIKFPEYPEFPEHPLKTNSVKFSDAVRKEIALLHGYYRASYFLLKKFMQSQEIQETIIVWPHHFDMAVLKKLTKDGEEGLSVGIGFSPGDEHYNEPYWYISPWPYPKDISVLQPLSPPGFWHTKGFISCVLKSSSISGAPQGVPEESAASAPIRMSKIIFEYLKEGHLRCLKILIG